MARYKVISEKGAYLPRSPQVVRLELGADSKAAKAYGVSAQICELLAEGEEIEGDHIAFGPHLEPLDDEARERAKAYWKKFPGATLDPTRSLPLGQDPMLQPTFEQAMLRSLERLAADQAGPAPAASASDAKLDALLEAVTRLIGHAAAPATTQRKGA